jgi:anthranilate synthase component 1
MNCLPAFQDFEKNYQAGKTQLVWQWVPADLETPVSAYLKLCADKPYSLLLESVEGGATLGRYSAIGLDPDLIWQYDGTDVFINDKKDSKAPLESLRQQLNACKIDVVDSAIPPMGPSGLFGYMGYDCIRLVENIPDTNPDELGIPESIMMRPTVMVVFDNVKNMMCVITPVRRHSDDKAKEIYDDAVKRVNDILHKLEGSVAPAQQTSKVSLPLKISSNMQPEQFHAMVEKAVKYIHAGEIFQAVLSQRFSVDFDLPAFDLYRSLRRLNPSPFLFFINFDGFSLVGSSPEILVRLRKGTVTIRPIAGTRKRGKDEAEDKELVEDLLADPKERAEHLMLLDLGRNDIGRVADISTVQVTDQFTVEYYSHVMHIVSNVEGKIKDGLDSLDALFAGFPAGTVSGAPKIRAMEIIDELEPARRSFYAGCVGYLDGNGDLDTCIALRTALVKDGKVYVQAGGGVVADSTPDFEYQESKNKAQAVIAAAEDAISRRQA